MQSGLEVETLEQTEAQSDLNQPRPPQMMGQRLVCGPGPGSALAYSDWQLVPDMLSKTNFVHFNQNKCVQSE